MKKWTWINRAFAAALVALILFGAAMPTAAKPNPNEEFRAILAAAEKMDETDVYFDINDEKTYKELYDRYCEIIVGKEYTGLLDIWGTPVMTEKDVEIMLLVGNLEQLNEGNIERLRQKGTIEEISLSFERAYSILYKHHESYDRLFDALEFVASKQKREICRFLFKPVNGEINIGKRFAAGEFYYSFEILPRYMKDPIVSFMVNTLICATQKSFEQNPDIYGRNFWEELYLHIARAENLSGKSIYIETALLVQEQIDTVINRRKLPTLYYPVSLEIKTHGFNLNDESEIKTRLERFKSQFMHPEKVTDTMLQDTLMMLNLPYLTNEQWIDYATNNSIDKAKKNYHVLLKIVYDEQFYYGNYISFAELTSDVNDSKMLMEFENQLNLYEDQKIFSKELRDFIKKLYPEDYLVKNGARDTAMINTMRAFWNANALRGKYPCTVGYQKEWTENQSYKISEAVEEWYIMQSKELSGKTKQLGGNGNV